jgi:hypothetical protein
MSIAVLGIAVHVTVLCRISITKTSRRDHLAILDEDNIETFDAGIAA